MFPLKSFDNFSPEEGGCSEGLDALVQIFLKQGRTGDFVETLGIKMKRRLTRDRTAEPVSRGQIFRRERGQRNINFP